MTQIGLYLYKIRKTFKWRHNIKISVKTNPLDIKSRFTKKLTGPYYGPFWYIVVDFDFQHFSYNHYLLNTSHGIISIWFEYRNLSKKRLFSSFGVLINHQSVSEETLNNCTYFDLFESPICRKGFEKPF